MRSTLIKAIKENDIIIFDGSKGDFIVSSTMSLKDLQNKTIVGINKRLQAYAEANDIAYVDYHSALADKQGGLPKTFSDDGCHPKPDTYYIMEKIVKETLHH